MKIYVPRKRHDLPSRNDVAINAMFAEITEGDLPRVIEFWKSLDQLQTFTSKSYFLRSVKEVCLSPPKKNTLEPYLRRPHITVHCGAKQGSPEASKVAHELMYETGKEVARNGFNLWYGGGDQGLMGTTMRGFNDALKERRYPDQYSIQVIPSQFVVGVQSINGNRPANEGLCTTTDVAIILPDFFARRDLLSSNCAGAISGIGGIGTMDEVTDILVHVKTGLRDADVYMLNAIVPPLTRGYWEPLMEFVQGAIQTGFESPQTVNHMRLINRPAEVFADLMPRLDAKGSNPHTVYAEYCRTHNLPAPKPYLIAQATPT